MKMEITILGLRVALIALLYLFLIVVVVIVARDLRGADRAVEARTSRYGYLVVVYGGEAELLPGDRIPLRPVTSLGRGMTNTVVLADPSISTEHALLTWRGEHWWSEDLGSTNGTYVDGERVTAPTVVHDNSLIQVGRVQLKLVQET